MIGYYDHQKQVVGKPVVVHDKGGVDDPHDNPSLAIDELGFLWVFVSGRGRSRPGFIFKSREPYSINGFEKIEEGEMTYPQPWIIEDQKFVYLFTKYTGVRELYYRTSLDGITWTKDKKLSGIREEGKSKSGHYQVSRSAGNKVSTFFNRHPNGGVDQRTDLYYLESTDFGSTWTDIDGTPAMLPLSDVDVSARVIDYAAQHKNVYLKDLCHDDKGSPICLYVTSGGHEPGPSNDPREWRITRWSRKRKWVTSVICTSDHNYDMGSLIRQGKRWYLLAPTTDGPQKWGTGGELAIWSSNRRMRRWKKDKQLTVGSKQNHSYVRSVVNGREPFLFFWADGNPDVFSASRIYFGDLEGNIWKLPYSMTAEEEKPIKLK